MDEPNDPCTEGSTRILVRARHLLQRGWCQKFWARDEFGRPVQYGEPAARQYCSVGAIARAHMELCLSSDDVACALQRVLFLIMSEREGAVTLWNDAPNRTHEEVLRLFDQAIGAK